MARTKACGKCKKVKSLSKFHKDRHKSTGLASTCKDCRATYDKQRNYNKPLKKIMDVARSRSKYLYPGPHECAVINCGQKAELHHFDYDKPEEVIPLCGSHHSAVHHIDLIYKKLEQNQHPDDSGYNQSSESINE